MRRSVIAIVFLIGLVGTANAVDGPSALDRVQLTIGRLIVQVEQQADQIVALQSQLKKAQEDLAAERASKSPAQ